MSRRVFVVLLSFAVVAGTVVFVLYATRTVRPDCKVAISRISSGSETPAEKREWVRSGEAKRQIEAAYRQAIADGRCEPPRARWRDWIG